LNNDINSAYSSSGARNMSRTSDPDLDSLLDQQTTSLTDANKRNDLLHQIQQKVLADYGMVPPFDHESVEAYQPWLQNYLAVVTGGGIDPYVDLYLWLNK
jgi:ABC-type transport system substrate-binding protein